MNSEAKILWRRSHACRVVISKEVIHIVETDRLSRQKEKFN
jgi:hypothetical protein